MLEVSICCCSVREESFIELSVFRLDFFRLSIGGVESFCEMTSVSNGTRPRPAFDSSVLSL